MRVSLLYWAILFISISVGVAFGIGCSGADSSLGLHRDMRVQGGQFIHGEIGPASSTGPAVTAIEALTGRVRHGMRSKFVGGRTVPDAYSVAVWLDGDTSGYWIRPVGAPSPAENNELTFSLLLDFSTELAPGRYDLRIAAIGEDGRRGESRRLGLCVAPPWPDNSNACDPSLRPPLVVVSLEWNSDANIDLVVVSPDGRVAGGRIATTAPLPSDTAPTAVPANIGRIDVDAGADCRRDSLRRENLVFRERPARGTYRIYARLTSPCGGGATTVRSTLLQRRGDGEEAWSLEPVRQDVTTLLPVQASPGGLGTYLFNMEF